MLKKTITYTDYDGVTRTEDFYFNLSKAELVKLTMRKNGTFEDYIRSIIAAKNVTALYTLFSDIIDMSYGKKSDDGRRFMKSPAILADFKETPAYDNLIMELATDDKASSKFIQAVMPKDLVSQARQEIKKNPNIINEAAGNDSSFSPTILNVLDE